MFDLIENSPLEMLRQFTLHYNADFEESLGAAKMTLNNSNGSGYIALFEPFEGLTAWIYNINFKEELHIDMTFSSDKMFYFGLNLNGYQLQKFPEDSEFQEIRQNQNFILLGKSKGKSQFVIPKNIEFQCCYLIIETQKLKKINNNNVSRLQSDLQELFGNNLFKELPYRHFGKIDFKTSEYVKFLVQNNRTDLVGRLLTEGAVLNILASQIDSHDKDNTSIRLQPKLTEEELSRVVLLGDLVRENITHRPRIQFLAQKLSMSSQKLQAAVKYLYGTTVNQFITNIRLEYAKELIHTTNMTISEICYHVGFSSRSHFSKIFLKRYNKLPAVYKNQFVETNQIFEVTYRSKANNEFKNRELDEILSTSRKMNTENNITGCLVYYKDVFFQMIEGNKNEVLKLYKNIQKDRRHYDVITLWTGYKQNRDFMNWSMGFTSENSNATITEDSSNLNLKNIIENKDKESLLSGEFWQNIRNYIKVS